jgi:hypothetical protein
MHRLLPGEQARRDEPLVPAADDAGRDPSSGTWSSSRKLRWLPKITSGSTGIDHGPPSTSMVALIAHPDSATDENLRSP